MSIYIYTILFILLLLLYPRALGTHVTSLERKEKEKQQKKEELKQLKALKRKEIEEKILTMM